MASQVQKASHDAFAHCLREIKAHNAYFDSIVNSIPANKYIAQDHSKDVFVDQSKYRKGQSKESKEVKKARLKTELFNKFDPEKAETTVEQTKRLAAEKVKEEEEKEEKGDDDESDSDNEVIEDNHEEEDEDMEVVDKADDTKSRDDKDKKSSEVSGFVDDGSMSRIEMLRAKLRAKMNERRAAGGLPPVEEMGATPQVLVSKRAGRRAEKKRKVAEEKERNKKRAATKVLDVARPKKRVATEAALGGSKLNDASKPETSVPVAEDLSTIDYGAVAGLKSKAKIYNEENKSIATKKKKSVERLLEEAEEKQRKLKELKESDDPESKAKAKKMEWGDTLKVASGEANARKSDVKILRKALKRKSKKKASSAKAWKSRVEEVKTKTDERQKIRTHNLDVRKEGGSVAANLSKKKIKEDKDSGKEGERKIKGRAGPHSKGYEGKKEGDGSDDKKATKEKTSK